MQWALTWFLLSLSLSLSGQSLLPDQGGGPRQTHTQRREHTQSCHQQQSGGWCLSVCLFVCLFVCCLLFVCVSTTVLYSTFSCTTLVKSDTIFHQNSRTTAGPVGASPESNSSRTLDPEPLWLSLSLLLTLPPLTASRLHTGTSAPHRIAIPERNCHAQCRQTQGDALGKAQVGGLSIEET